jgi:hypothetical protein
MLSVKRMTWDSNSNTHANGCQDALEGLWYVGSRMKA